MTTTMTTLRTAVDADPGPSTAERRITAESHLRRNLGITDSVRERVRTKLIDVPIEDSPVKRDRRGRDEQLLSKIRGVSPASSVSSNDSPRPTSLLGPRLLSSRHKQTPSNSHAFPNEYSIPTIPLPPSPDLKPPESPSRFRRKTPTKQVDREISVRFSLPDDDSEDIFLSPVKPTLTSTPTQQFLDEQADVFDSAKSLISSTLQSSSTPSRFRRESPSKLLRTLSRATATPVVRSEESIYHSPRIESPPESDEEMSLDEADETLNSIIESAEDASTRIRRVLEQSRQHRALRQSPSQSSELRETSAWSSPAQPEMSVWGEKSFFRRMAKKAPGGWAFTPQPKLRAVDVQDKGGNNANINASMKQQESDPSGKWWEFWRKKRKVEPANEDEPLERTSIPQSHPPKQSSTSVPPENPDTHSSSIVTTPSLSTLSEKRLRLARSLHLLQSDIRLAREGIETLESRLESIQLASTARQIDSERRVILRRQRGDPPPVITIPAKPQALVLRAGTYVWLPFQRRWIVWMLWIIVVFQAVLLSLGKGRGRERWEPYSFGEWGRDIRWPT